MCSDKGVMLETLTLETLYSGQSTVGTQLITPNCLEIPLAHAAVQFL